MQMPSDKKSIRACALELIDTITRFDKDGDSNQLRLGLLAGTRPLLERDDLYELGTKRQANHIENSRWLYYDGQMSLSLDEFPKGKVIPPHDHGIWEALVLCKGRLRHTVYERADDGSIDGKAELRPVEDIEMKVGEITMVVPPGDIHSFEAVSDQTYVITIVGGDYSLLRHYFNTSDNTYAVRTPKALRDSGALT